MGPRIDPRLIPKRPNFKFEKKLWAAGIGHVAGLDEAGRGALAGPVVAAAVVFHEDGKAFRQLRGVRDSKEIGAKQREAMRIQIMERCLDWGVGSASAKEIDLWGIVPATRLAMQRALGKLSSMPEHLLIDALTLENVSSPQAKLLKGDQRSLSIAAASILAKQKRDAKMIEYAKEFPGYGFVAHKGYGTQGHRAQLEVKGPCQIHRKSFQWKKP